MPYEEYFEKVKSILNGFTFYTLDLTLVPNQHERGYGIFRARQVVDNLFTSTEDLWAPPKEIVRSIGRCHDVGESMLYCSNFFGTCLIECRAKKNTRWVLTEYEIIRGQKFIIVPLGLNAERFLKGEANPYMIPSILDSLSPVEKKKFLRINEYLKTTFKQKIEKDISQYKRTVAIVHYLTKCDNFKGQDIAIMYPSVPSQFYGINFAFNGIEAKRKLRIKNTYYVEVKNIDLKKRCLEFSFLADGNISDKNIIWTQNKTNHFDCIKKQ